MNRHTRFHQQTQQLNEARYVQLSHGVSHEIKRKRPHVHAPLPLLRSRIKSSQKNQENNQNHNEPQKVDKESPSLQNHLSQKWQIKTRLRKEFIDLRNNYRNYNRARNHKGNQNRDGVNQSPAHF